MRAGVVQVGLGARKGHAVVAGHDDHRPIEAAGLLDLAHDLAGVVVVSLDGKVVIENIVPRLRRIEEERGDFHIRGLEARFGALPLAVGAMRVAAAVPEAEWLARRDRAEEGLKVRKDRPGRVPRSLAELAGRPSLAHVPDKIARLLQQIGIDGELRRERAVEVRPFLQAVGELAGQDQRARGGAAWRDAERMREQRPLAGDAVEGGCLHAGVAVNAGVREGPVVGDGEEDVGPWRRDGRPRRLRVDRRGQARDQGDGERDDRS